MLYFNSLLTILCYVTYCNYLDDLFCLPQENIVRALCGSACSDL